MIDFWFHKWKEGGLPLLPAWLVGKWIMLLLSFSHTNDDGWNNSEWLRSVEFFFQRRKTNCLSLRLKRRSLSTFLTVSLKCSIAWKSHLESWKKEEQLWIPLQGDGLFPLSLTILHQMRLTLHQMLRKGLYHQGLSLKRHVLPPVWTSQPGLKALYFTKMA